MPEKILNENEKRLRDSLEAVEAGIIALFSKIKLNKGRLISDDLNLQRAVNMRIDILKEFAPYFNASQDIIDTYKDTGVKSLFKGVNITFTQADASIVRQFQNDSFANLSFLGNETAANIGGIVYKGVIAGAPLKDIVGDVRQTLIGKTGRSGKPLSSHATTIAEDQYMAIDAIMMKRKGDEVGIKKYRYTGSLIKDSRQWCIDHVGNVLTLKEIEDWDNQSWQGKAPGSSFITRGGYRCRHRWSPVNE